MAEALAAGGWDLVLSDYRLPEFSGMEALRVLQASGPGPPLHPGVRGHRRGGGGGGPEGRGARLRAQAQPGPALPGGGAGAEGRRRPLGAVARPRRSWRRSEERYRALFAHSPMPLSVQDFSAVKALFDGYREQGVRDLRGFFEAHPGELRRCAQAVRIREGNEARTRFLGGDPTGTGWHAGASFLDASWPVFREELAAFAEGATSFQGEMPIRGADGAAKVISLHMSVSPGCKGSLARVLVSFMDVTERIRMETALRDLDRISAKGQMVACIAHEINNPLAGIKNAFALLEPAIAPDHPHRRYAELIRREIDRIAGIIRTLYHVLPAPPPPSPGRWSWRRCSRTSRACWSPSAGPRGSRSVLDLPDRGLQVRCNGGMLRQVIFNLAQNAVEASPSARAPWLLGARRAGRACRDHRPGPGRRHPARMGRADLPAGLHQQGGSEMSGLGLGLSTCKSIVQSMGGTLGFNSGGPGPGCTFRVPLPAPAQRRAAARIPGGTPMDHRAQAAHRRRRGTVPAFHRRPAAPGRLPGGLRRGRAGGAAAAREPAVRPAALRHPHARQRRPGAGSRACRSPTGACR